MGLSRTKGIGRPVLTRRVCSSSNEQQPSLTRWLLLAFAVFDMWDPVWRQLTPEASLKVRKANYERIFNEGRRRVREWEAKNVK